jgi:class 3 adenylate cyclase
MSETGNPREIELALLIADLSGYTALTETHGALHASDIVFRFGRMAESSLEPGVGIVDRIGDQVLCAGADPLAVLRTALRLSAQVEGEPDFLSMQAGIHRGNVVEREGRLFGSPLNLTSRIAAYARGGQILCTESIASIAREVSGVTLVPLGQRRFKNVSSPVQVLELLRNGRSGHPTAIDPVCRMRVEVGRVAAIPYQGISYHFCSEGCARLFAATPERYARLWG